MEMTWGGWWRRKVGGALMVGGSFFVDDAVCGCIDLRKYVLCMVLWCAW